MNDGVPEPARNQELVTAAADWLWHGMIARGNLSLLTGLWKGGKTSLLSLLLARRRTGGTLAGLEVRPGKSVVISEEGQAKWRERALQYDFGGQAWFFPQPFRTLPRPGQWQALVERVLRLHEEQGVDLAIVDPLAPFLRAENSVQGVLETLLPLGELTRRGMAVLAAHHPTKGSPRPGQAARGSGAILGHVDVSIEMRHPGGDALTSRRRLLGFSRHAETPRQLLIELNAEATDYTVVSDAPQDEFPEKWEVVRSVLLQAPQKLTREDILDEWPEGPDKPATKSLWRWLRRAVDLHLVACEGAGVRNDPYRYWLPEREEHWRATQFMYDHFEQVERDLKIPFKSLRERRRQDEEERRRMEEDDRRFAQEEEDKDENEDEER